MDRTAPVRMAEYLVAAGNEEITLGVADPLSSFDIRFAGDDGWGMTYFSRALEIQEDHCGEMSPKLAETLVGSVPLFFRSSFGVALFFRCFWPFRLATQTSR